MQGDHFIEIYQNRARAYERMIDAEDADGNLWRTLSRLVDFSGKGLVDLGSGTGRLPQLLHRHAAWGLALDLHQAMLLENRRQQQAQQFDWPLVQGELQALPLASGCASIVTAGWAVGHFCGWYGAQWRVHVERALQEMVRIARPGADIVILETLGTGVLQPAPPTACHAAYYRLLEEVWGFERHEVTTDYQFATVTEAVEAMTFFFGEALAQEIRRRQWHRVPEWTAIWRLRTAG